jgi:thiol-disulfide isomerase/thioredoxin
MIFLIAMTIILTVRLVLQKLRMNRRSLQCAPWVGCLAGALMLQLCGISYAYAAGQEHMGKLSSDLIPNQARATKELLPASSAERESLPVQLSADDLVFAGDLAITHDRKMKLLLVEPAHGQPYLFADVNLSGVLENTEKFTFGPWEQGELNTNPEVIVRVKLQAGPYSVYPIRIQLPGSSMYRDNSDGKGGRTLLMSQFVFVHGIVEIGGAPVAVIYQFNMATGTARADYGWQGMDCNGDGRIDQHINQPEFVYAQNETVLFDVRGHALSTASLDLASKTFLVQEHPAADNQRISLRAGDVMPDFAFTDLDGRKHLFSEFRGKFVLLNFWGTWCPPCRAELPTLQQAYNSFRPRNFVILGIDDDEDRSKAKTLLLHAGVTYSQAGGESGTSLVEKRFRIGAFPTNVLVGPDGRIALLGEELNRQHILETLDRILPAAH